MEIKQAVILAGGLGTRMGDLTKEIPKPMISINGKPLLEYTIKNLKSQGVEEIILLTGYLSEKIESHFGDGSRFGVNIKYSRGDIDFDTGKRVKHATHLLQDKFFLLYGDNYHPIDLKKVLDLHNEKCRLVTCTLYSNRGNFTKNNTIVDDSGTVTLYDGKREHPKLNSVDIGYFVFDKRVLDLMPDTNFSLQEIQKLLTEKGQLSGYVTDHIYCGLSNPERIPFIENFLKNRKIIFLDRDGTINKESPRWDYVKSWNEFKFLPGAEEAMKLLTNNGYEIYIITNQAGIARKIMSEDDLNDIHERMLQELESKCVKISDIYYCKHGWDDGCFCRKPKPGMFYQASQEHAIDLTKALFIGNNEKDLQAGESAGVKTILVNEENNMLDIVEGLVD